MPTMLPTPVFALASAPSNVHRGGGAVGYAGNKVPAAVIDRGFGGPPSSALLVN